MSHLPAQKNRVAGGGQRDHRAGTIEGAFERQTMDNLAVPAVHVDAVVEVELSVLDVGGHAVTRGKERRTGDGFSGEHDAFRVA